MTLEETIDNLQHHKNIADRIIATQEQIITRQQQALQDRGIVFDAEGAAPITHPHE